MSLDQALKKFTTNDKQAITHTKIGDPKLNIFGGKYSIKGEDEKSFYETYQDVVFKKKQDAYLTEKQLECGKLAIDIDLRYTPDIIEKQHTKEHIDDFVEFLVSSILLIFPNVINKDFKIYIFEKENVNQCGDKTKDGIHIIVNMYCDVAAKMVLRDYIVKNVGDIWDDLPITNKWGDVFDEGVMRGNANWQLYGSKKPGCEPYKLKYMYTANVPNKEEIDIESLNPLKQPFDFMALSVRNTKNCFTSPIHDNYKNEYEKHKKTTGKKSSNSAIKVRRKQTCSSLNEITCVEDIENLVEETINSDENDYLLKEVHEYTMSLPKEFWGPGSYDKWIRVGWALKNTHEKLLITWLLFCSQSEDFDFKSCEAQEMWEHFDVYNKEGLSHKSIIYWSKTFNPEEHAKIYKNTINYYINYSFKNNTEFDLAITLFNMNKCQYVCSSITHNTWYEFMNNRWKIIDSGSSLRLKISTQMFKEYSSRTLQYQATNQARENNIDIGAQTQEAQNQIIASSSEDFTDYKKKVAEMLTTCKLLKKTTTKNNIMREAKELFYDRDFINKLDSDPYLIGCDNCVIDFRERTHRKGKHDDYISKSTCMNYMPLEHYQKNEPEIIDQIHEFMAQLFPDPLLKQYIYEHLASTLIGTNENQTFNIYTGSGANGKSKLVELMTLILGEYKGTVPISLITQKRNNIGGTSSEVFNLIGTRYAVMQEPSKGDKINEGIMKELTGGDPIQCRALFQDSITFTPQFKMCVCTNTLFDVVSNDDGTWRRMRVVEFKSKFTDKPYNDPKFPKSEYPNQFMVDTKIDEKFKKWAPVFLSILVDVAYKTQGKVNDVEPVLAATQEYRKNQDIIEKFMIENICDNPEKTGFPVKKTSLTQPIKKFIEQFSNYNTKQQDFIKHIEKKYGKYPNGGWKNFKLISDQGDNDVNCD